MSWGGGRGCTGKSVQRGDKLNVLGGGGEVVQGSVSRGGII